MFDPELDEAIRLSLAHTRHTSDLNSQEKAFFLDTPLDKIAPGTDKKCTTRDVSSRSLRLDSSAKSEKNVDLKKESRSTKNVQNVFSPGADNKVISKLRSIISSGKQDKALERKADVFNSSGDNLCKICNESIKKSSNHLLALEGKCHVSCFRCDGCGNPISGQYVPYGNPKRPYHQACHRELFHPRCSLCNDFLPTRYMKQNEILEPEGAGYCPNHVADCEPCFSCNRRQPTAGSRRSDFTRLPDGRLSCSECITLAIFDSSEAKPLYSDVIDFMEHTLGLPIPAGMRDVPILAVDLPSLNEQRHLESVRGTSGCHECDSYSNHNAQRSGKHPSTSNYCTSIARGLTLSVVSEVRHYAPGSIHYDDRRGWLQSAPTVVKLQQHREVTAVLVLCCLPRDLTLSIIAHEAFHVWIKLQRNMPVGLPPQVEEGMCQLIASLFLKDIIAQGSMERGRGALSGNSLMKNNNLSSNHHHNDSEWHLKLRKYFLWQLENDISDIYGDGYRIARECFQTLGLHPLIEFIRENKQFPII